MLDSLVVQKRKSGLGFTRVEPLLNHNCSCNPVSCDDAHFDVTTHLTVNPPFVDNDSVSVDCNDNASIFTSIHELHDSSSNNLLVNDCVDSDNFCEIKSVNISHEVPFTILKHANIPIKNQINTNELSILNEQKLSVSSKNKPIYRNKAEAKKQLDRFVSGGTSVHESVKFTNDINFSQKDFHDCKLKTSQYDHKVTSNDASTSNSVT